MRVLLQLFLHMLYLPHHLILSFNHVALVEGTYVVALLLLNIKSLAFHLRYLVSSSIIQTSVAFSLHFGQSSDHLPLLLLTAVASPLSTLHF